MLIQSDPNNMNSIVYHLIIERYSMKTLHWYFPWATALHLYNMTGRGEKLQQLHCYHPFSYSLDIYLTKNHYENYSPKMVPIAKIWGSGSWTNISFSDHATTYMCSWLHALCLCWLIMYPNSHALKIWYMFLHLIFYTCLHHNAKVINDIKLREFNFGYIRHQNPFISHLYRPVMSR